MKQQHDVSADPFNVGSTKMWKVLFQDGTELLVTGNTIKTDDAGALVVKEIDVKDWNPNAVLRRERVVFMASATTWRTVELMPN